MRSYPAYDEPVQPLLPDWAADVIDPQRPSPARVYDHLLGGLTNFDADRRIAARLVEIVPELAHTARAGRGFLQRAVEYLADAGIDQFLDLGSGIPTAGNVHEIALRADPAARVVYIDVDAAAVAVSRRLLAENSQAAMVQADFTDIDGVLAHPQVTAMLDFTRPMAILLVSVLHSVTDDAAAATLFKRLSAMIAPGSRVVLSHLTAEGDREPVDRMFALAEQATGRGIRPRSRAEIAELLGDLTLVDPGLVHMARWRPDPDAPLPEVRALDGYAAVAVKP